MAQQQQQIEYVKRELRVPANTPLPPVRQTTVQKTDELFHQGDIIVLVHNQKTTNEKDLKQAWNDLIPYNKSVLVYRVDGEHTVAAPGPADRLGQLPQHANHARGQKVLPQMTLEPVRLPEQNENLNFFRETLLKKGGTSSAGTSSAMMKMEQEHQGTAEQLTTASGTSSSGGSSSSSSGPVTSSSSSSSSGEENHVQENSKMTKASSTTSIMKNSSLKLAETDMYERELKPKPRDEVTFKVPRLNSAMAGGNKNADLFAPSSSSSATSTTSRLPPGGMVDGGGSSLEEYLADQKTMKGRNPNPKRVSFPANEVEQEFRFTGSSPLTTDINQQMSQNLTAQAVSGSPIRSIQMNKRYPQFHNADSTNSAGGAAVVSTGSSSASIKPGSPTKQEEIERIWTGAGSAGGGSSSNLGMSPSEVMLSTAFSRPRVPKSTVSSKPRIDLPTREDAMAVGELPPPLPPRHVTLYSLSEELRSLSSSVKLRLSLLHPSQGGLGGDMNPTESSGSEDQFETQNPQNSQNKNTKECQMLDERALLLLRQAEQNLALSDFSKELRKISPDLESILLQTNELTTSNNRLSTSITERLDFQKLLKFVKNLQSRNLYLVDEFQKQANTLQKHLLQILASTHPKRQAELESRWRQKNAPVVKTTGSHVDVDIVSQPDKLSVLQTQLFDVVEVLHELNNTINNSHQAIYDILPDREKRKLFTHLPPFDRNAILLSPWELAELQKTGTVALKDAKHVSIQLTAQFLNAYLQRTHFDVARDLAGELPDEFVSPIDRELLANGDFSVLSKTVLPMLKQKADQGVEMERLVLHSGLLSSKKSNLLVDAKQLEKTIENQNSNNSNPDDFYTAQNKQQKAKLVLRQAAEEARETLAARDRLAALLDGPARSMIAEEHAPGLPAVVDAIETGFKAHISELATNKEEKKALIEMGAKKQRKLEEALQENKQLKEELEQQIKRNEALEQEFDSKEQSYRRLLASERADKATALEQLQLESMKHTELKQKSAALLATLETANQELTGLHRKTSEKINVCADLRTALSDSLSHTVDTQLIEN
ncbi:unnamed protein product [Amoebophrya sp. A120]|nr:unnamed protein product [Amoebophrya sp. A120]|eukprot:GSA120T00007853001.1